MKKRDIQYADEKGIKEPVLRQDLVFQLLKTQYYHFIN